MYQSTYDKGNGSPNQGKYATVPVLLKKGVKKNHQRSSKGMVQMSEFFIEFHIIFDCNCMTCCCCFLTLAISFLSPVRVAFIESDLQAVISLFQAFNCSMFVSRLFVIEVAKVIVKVINKMKIVEYGIIVNCSNSMSDTPFFLVINLQRNLLELDTYQLCVPALKADSIDRVCLQRVEPPFLIRILRRSRLKLQLNQSRHRPG